MTVFAGHYGSVELKRVGDSHVLDLEITKSDLYVSRKRFALGMANSLDLPFGTITTGDRIRISTQDARGLPFRSIQTLLTLNTLTILVHQLAH